MKLSLVLKWVLLAVLTLQAGVFAANSAPEPSAPGIVTQQNTAATTQVSANDVDVGDTAGYTIVANPAHGSANVSSSGLVTYTPANNYYGSDSLQVRVTDGAGAAGTVTISVFVRGALIPTSLPEHVPFNAAIVAACQSTITMKYPSTVEAYFLDEGAGYHNRIAWYNVADKTNVHTIFTDASSVLDLLGNTDGTLHTGDRVELGTFSSGETIGFYLHNITGLHATLTSDAADNSDGLKHVLILAIPDSDFVLVSFEDKAYQSDYDYNDVIMLLRIGRLNVQHWIDTSTRPLQYVPPTKYQTELNNLTEADTDGDGVPDSQDQFPSDPTRAFISLVPTPEATIVAYEDEFPGLGDYDFNDAIVAYHVAYITNASNQLVEIRGDAKLLTHGAANSHDWHLRFIGSSFSATATVTQTPGDKSSNSVSTRNVSSTTSTDPAKSEIDLPVILDTGASLPWKSGNTTPGWFKGNGDTATFSIVFATPIDPAVLQGAPFDPYLIVRDNGLDIHLLTQPLRKGSINPQGARSMLNAEGMPWALVIPANWQWPVEKTDIRTSFPRFSSWTGSAGVQDANWYLTPQQANVVMTPLSGDKSIWAGNQVPPVGKRSFARANVAPGFDFATLTTRQMSFVANERVVVSLLPLGADPADAANQSVATFRMQGTAVQSVQVPAIWESCIAVVTPTQGAAWTATVNFKAASVDISAAACNRKRLAVTAFQVKVSPKTGTASLMLTGCVDPEVLNVTAGTGGTLYVGGVPVRFGAGASALKITTPGSKSFAPWKLFTVKASGLDVTPWQNSGVLDRVTTRKAVKVPVTMVAGGVVLFGEANIVAKAAK